MGLRLLLLRWRRWLRGCRGCTGVSVVTRRTEVGKSVGSYGWDGGLGTSWFNDPVEDLTAILLTQRAWTSPVPGPVFRDFWTTAAAALGD